MKKIDVYYCGWGENWKLGQLADDRRRILFEYSPEAIRQGLELSPLNLKLRSESYSDLPTYQFGLPGLIVDSLPDGWGLFLMDKLFQKQGIKIEEISPLDRLSFLGDRTMGALRFEPSSIEAPESRDFTLLEIAKEVTKLIENNASIALRQLAIIGGSPHGARPKVLVNYNKKSSKISTDLLPSENSWFIKFPAEREHKEVCAVEYFYSKLALQSGLEIVDTEYFDLGKKLSAFGMKRFDRTTQYRIPTHTLAGALHANFRIPSSVDYLSFLRFTRFLTRNEQEVIKAFRQCVFNVVFNNRDDHSKNFSYLLDQNKEWKLSPAYDLTYSVGPGGEHQMDICGEGRVPDHSHLLNLSEKSGLNKKKCETIINEIIAVASKFKKQSKDFEITKPTINKIDQSIKSNIKRLIIS